MRGLSAVGGQQRREGRRRQEGSSGGGEGGGAAVVAKGLRVVAVDEGGVAGHGGGLAAQRFPPQRGRVDVGRELLVGEVRVGDEGTSHTVVTWQHVRACRGGGETLVFIRQQRKAALRRSATCLC